MSDNFLLSNNFARELYAKVKDLPIYDYHCHLSPQEIYEDKSLDNIGQMWLYGDHYKWRIMRAAGVDEKYITGNAPWRDKFIKYAEVSALAAGNPLYVWNRMELEAFFGVKTPLDAESAAKIWDMCVSEIKTRALSPRKLIKQSNVKYIATTDDPADSLEYHKLLAADKTFGVKVAPAFRVDTALNLYKGGYPEYAERLSKASGVKINGVDDLFEALAKRLDYFTSLGCKFSDVGLPFFPSFFNYKNSKSASAEKDYKTDSDEAFRAALNGRPGDISERGFDAVLCRAYVFLAGEYAKRGVVMQLHLMAMRNMNSTLFAELGADVGGDGIGDAIPYKDIAAFFDVLNTNGALPKTVVYPLNPNALAAVSTIAGSFRNVICGAAWWYNDQKRGIREQMEIIAETGYIGSFLGMLTDSRSFMSYPRHDYFRRILCSMLGEWVEGGEYEHSAAFKLAEAISCGNIRKLIFGDNGGCE